uniref:Signal recognition particle subunit SRP68 n=1 Tax=Callorhinchus milii TaxID=7868 RepID=A0A4W3GW12_CALMI
RANSDSNNLLLGFPFLQIIKDSQQQHGLRHQDYQRYRYLLLVLINAERAWSYAMQLKQEANTEPRKRFHLFSRLKKAVKHGEELERLCESNRVDAKTKLEAQAYTAYLTGMLNFELQEWKRAMEALHTCKTIYEKLASAFTDEQAVLYRQRVDEISPNIRYCDYNIGDPLAMNELIQMRLRSGESGGLLDTLITQTRAKQAATMSEVEWRGRVIPVKIDKVRIFLLGLADNEAAIAQAPTDEAKERLYESLLSECRDAIQAVREELRADPKQRERSLEPDLGKVSILQYLHSYLAYIKLSTAIKRNVSMAEALQKQLNELSQEDGKRVPRPQDLIRVYEIILQNLSELTQLPGLEEDKNFQKEVELKTLAYKAYRCFFIAQSYVLVKKWSEVLVLYERVLKYISEFQTLTSKPTNNLQDLPDMRELAARVNAEKYSLQAAAILDTDEVSDMVSQLQVKDNKPLAERLEVFSIEPSLVTKHAFLVEFPPHFQPIPCKPLFFDLALNHATFPPLEDKVEQKGRGGLTGYIKGFFGFRG